MDQATAAQTIEELKSEIKTLKILEQQAKTVVLSGQDKKWEELSSILQDNKHMFAVNDNRRPHKTFDGRKPIEIYQQLKLGEDPPLAWPSKAV